MNKLRHRPGVAPLSTPTAPNSSQQQQQQQQQQQTQQPPRSDTIHKPKEEPLSWTCELCGRSLASREEWMQHARLVSRLRFQYVFKIIIVFNCLRHGFLIYCRSHLETSAPPQHAAAYFPGSAPPPQPYNPERHFCLMCRTDFTDKAEFMFHVRSHFEPHAQQAAAPQQGGASSKQGGDSATAELIARGLVDPSGLCS